MGHIGKTVTQNVVSGSEITDGTVTGADLASDIAISTSGAITTTGAFTSKGIDDNADAVAMTIDSSENVGIGTTSPASPLGTNFKVLDINSGVWGGNLNFSGNSGGYIGNRHSGNPGLGYYAVSGQGHDFAVNGSTTSVVNINSSGAVTKPLQPRLSVYQYSAQTISHNTYTKLKLDGTDSITNGFTGWTQSNTHTRWTTATAGTYRITASMRWFTNSAISTSLMDILLNGSRITFGYDHSLGNYEQLHAMTIHDLSANDYLELQVYQYSGGDVAMNGGSANLVRLTANLIA